MYGLRLSLVGGLMGSHKKAKKNRAEAEAKVLQSGYCCPYDKLLCKRVDCFDGFPACWTYDVKGRLRFVCKRFVAPAGFSIPKQSPLKR